MTGDARPEDIGVDEPDSAAELLERERKIDADRGLADAALSAAHRDEVPDPRQPFRTGGWLGRRIRRVVVAMVRVRWSACLKFLSFSARRCSFLHLDLDIGSRHANAVAARPLARPVDQRPPLSERRTSRRARGRSLRGRDSPSAKGPPLCVYVLSSAKNVPSTLNKAIRLPWTSTSRA